MDFDSRYDILQPLWLRLQSWHVLIHELFNDEHVLLLYLYIGYVVKHLHEYILPELRADSLDMKARNIGRQPRIKVFVIQTKMPIRFGPVVLHLLNPLLCLLDEHLEHALKLKSHSQCRYASAEDQESFKIADQLICVL